MLRIPSKAEVVAYSILLSRDFRIRSIAGRKTLLRIRQANLEASEMALLETLNRVEEFIQSLSDSRIRRIIRFRIVDDMTWARVSVNMGGYATDESVRKEFERFMEK